MTRTTDPHREEHQAQVNYHQNMATCPRCKKPIEGYPAVSRVDNETDICSPCGTKEAMWDFNHRGDDLPMPPVNQPL